MMADRRPWPSSTPPAAATSITVQRARAMARVSSAELRAFLVGLRTAQVAAEDAAEETYHAADRLSGADRAEGNARAAGAKLAARRIGALFDAAAALAEEPPPRRGLRALLARLSGGQP